MQHACILEHSPPLASLAFHNSTDMRAFLAVISLARMPARAADRHLRAQQFVLLLLHTDAEEGEEFKGTKKLEELSTVDAESKREQQE